MKTRTLENEAVVAADEMSFRDWLAGQALIGLLADPKRPSTNTNMDIAASAYDLADAMMRARDK